VSVPPIEGSLFSQGPVVVFRWRMDDGWSVEFVSDSIAEVFGYEPARFLSGDLLYARIIHPDDLEAVAAEVRDHLRNGPDTFQHRDYRIVAADGAERWVQDFTVLDRDADGWVHGATGYLVDVTSHKVAEAALLQAHGELERRVAERTAALTREIAEREAIEAELRRRDAIQRALNETTARLFAASDWTAIVDGVLTAVGEAAGVDRVHIFENGLGAGGEGVARLRFEWAAAGIAGRLHSPAARQIPLDCAASERWVRALGRGEALQALARDMPEAERDLAMAMDVKAVLMVPIFVGEAWWGGIGFVDAHAERTWRDIDVQALRVVAGALGTAIRRARDDKALRDSEERLRGAVESLQEEFALFDADDRLVVCNEAFRRRHATLDRAVRERWTYEAMLRAEVEAGLLVEARGREEAFLRDRLERHRDPRGSILRTFADGSAALIKESRTAEGGTAITFADVTPLQRANAALEAAKTEAETARALLQDALESTTEAFALYDAEGRLVIFNKAYRQLYRHSPDLLKPGVSFETILRDRLRRNMVPDLAGDGEEWVRRRLAIFFRASGSIERVFPGGTWWKMDEQRTANGGIAQIATDITAIKAREEALRESEERFRRLFEDTAVGAAMVGPDGRYQMVNRAFCAMLGHARDELLGMSPADITHPQDREADHQGPDSLREMGPMTEEKRYVRKDGQVVWAMVSTSVIRDAAGKPASTLCHVQDISERKRAEEAGRRLQTQLAHVTRVSTMGQMATGFAHELNQPLAAIVNYAQGCLRRHRSGAISADDFAHAMELIVGQGHRAGDIIRRIRRFVQKDAPDVRAVDVNAAIREAVGLAAGEALGHGVDVRLDLAEALPAVQADAVQLQQVVLNLARNAIEAIGEEEAEEGRLTLSTRFVPPGQVEIRVADTGPGIDDALRMRIFDPFFTTKASGMGMGLPICRSIVESFGGTLTLDAGAAEGATFRMLLRRAGGTA